MFEKRNEALPVFRATWVLLTRLVRSLYAPITGRQGHLPPNCWPLGYSRIALKTNLRLCWRISR